MNEKIRIKDIAERAGVSVGTVDRVLHDRPNVSKPAREKVERALKEGNPLYPVPKIMDAKDCEKVIKAVRGF